MSLWFCQAAEADFLESSSVDISTWGTLLSRMTASIILSLFLEAALSALLRLMLLAMCLPQCLPNLFLLPTSELQMNMGRFFRALLPA